MTGVSSKRSFTCSVKSAVAVVPPAPTALLEFQERRQRLNVAAAADAITHYDDGADDVNNDGDNDDNGDGVGFIIIVSILLLLLIILILTIIIIFVFTIFVVLKLYVSKSKRIQNQCK